MSEAGENGGGSSSAREDGADGDGARLAAGEPAMGMTPAGGSPLVLDHAASGGGVTVGVEFADVRDVVDARVHRRRMYFRALWSGAAARVLNIAVQVLSISLTVRYLGKERFGIWTTVSTAIAWLGVTNFGMGHGLITRVASLAAAGRREAALRAALSAWSLIAIVTMALLPICAAVALWVPWASVLNVKGALAARECTPTVLVSVILALVAVPLSTVGPILMGHQRTDLANGTVAIASVSGLVLLFVGTRLGWGMPALAAVLVVPSILASVIQTVIALRLGLLRFSRRYVSFAEAADVLKLGSKFLLLQLFGILIFETGAVIIATRFGAAEVTPYGVTSRVVMMIVTAYTVIMAPLWPAYGDAFARGDRGWARRVFLRTGRVVLVVWVVAAVCLSLAGKWIIRIWAGADAVPGTGLLWAMLLYALSYGWGLVVAQPLNGSGQIGKQVLAAAVTAALNIPLGLWLSNSLGVAGVVLSQAVLMLGLAIPIQLVGVMRVLESGGKGSTGATPQEGVKTLAGGETT
jgi:O-antigen/teichoic acid export membrane protein